MFNTHAFRVIPLPRLNHCLEVDMSLKAKARECAQVAICSAFGVIEHGVSMCSLGTVQWPLHSWATFELMDNDEPQIVRLARQGQV